MDIKSVKLKNGQELITRIGYDDTGNYIILDNPVGLILGPQGAGFSPFMLSSSETKFQIPKDEVLVLCDTDKKIQDQYLSMITGIDLGVSDSSKFSI